MAALLRVEHIVFIILIGLNTATSENGETKLVKKLFKDYNTESRPVLNDSDTVVVRLGIALHQLVEVKEKQEYFSISLFVRQIWRDESLVWNPVEYNNVTSVNVSPRKIWLPDLVLYNNVDEDKSFGGSLDRMNNRVIINNDGTVKWLTPVIFRAKCAMNVEYFPFDTQICSLKFGSWTYNGFQIDLKNLTESVDFAPYSKHSEWLIPQGVMKRNVLKYTCCPEPFPDVTITLTLKRRSLFYLLNLIFPMVVISMLTMLSFYLPAESGERIALAITLLLAMTVFMLIVGEIIPPTSDTVPLVATFFSAVMLEMVLMVVLLCYILKLHFKTPDDKMPNWMKIIVLDNLSYTLGIRSKKKRHPDDDYMDQVKNAIELKCNNNDDTAQKQQNGGYENGTAVTYVHNGAIHKNSDINPTFENCFITRQTSEEKDNAYLRTLSNKMDIFLRKLLEDEHTNRLKNDWRICALTIDRISLFLFALIFIATTLGIFLRAPEYVS